MASKVAYLEQIAFFFIFSKRLPKHKICLKTHLFSNLCPLHMKIFLNFRKTNEVGFVEVFKIWTNKKKDKYRTTKITVLGTCCWEIYDRMGASQKNIKPGQTIAPRIAYIRKLKTKRCSQIFVVSWYFISKIVVTYCCQKINLSMHKKFQTSSLKDNRSLKPLQNKKGQKNLGYPRKKQSFNL